MDPVGGTAAGRLRRLGAAQRRGREEGLADVIQHVRPRRDKLLLCDRLNSSVVIVVPSAVRRVLAVGSVVTSAQGPCVVAHSEEVVDVVEARIVEAPEGVQGTWGEEVAVM